MFKISNKISKDKWLNTKIKYSENIMSDCLRYIFTRVIKWINNQDEIIYIGDFNTDYENFTEFIYNYYIPPVNKLNQSDDEEFEYFDLKYNDDILNLFLDLKEYTRSKNLNLFHNSTYDFLIDYIYSIVEINDRYNDDINEYDDYSNYDDTYESYN